MSLSSTMLAADFAYILADLPQTVTYAGTSYSAVVSSVNTNNDLMLEGYKARLELTVYVKQSDFTPAVGQKLTYSGSQYRIDAVDKSQDGINWRINCKELMA